MELPGSTACSVIEQGRGFVAGRGNFAVVGVYVTPNIGQVGYAFFLGELTVCVTRLRVRPTVVLVVFNAHATA
jgi:hypothetical protein